MTVSQSLSSFTYTHEGQKCDKNLSPSDLAGLTLFVWNGGTAGTDCDPVFCIDNFRVVPIE